MKKSNRGFFSEALGKLHNDEDAKMAQKFPQMSVKLVDQSIQNSACLPEIPSPERKKVLMKPEKVVEINFMEYPSETLEPIMILQYSLMSGPEAYRKTQEFKKLKIAEALKDLGVSAFQLLPVSFHKKQDFNKSSSNVLPLGWFDDQTTDPLEPKGWLSKMIVDGEKYPLPAEAFLPVYDLPSRQFLTKENANYFYNWRKVGVVSYSESTQLWLVKDFKLNLEFHLHRIYIRFLAEDPIVFAARVKEAVACQEKAEIYLRFLLMVDTVILNGFSEPQQHIQDAVIKLMYNKKQTLNLWWLEMIEKEHTIFYQKFMYVAEWALFLKRNPDMYPFISVPVAGFLFNIQLVSI